MNKVLTLCLAAAMGFGTASAQFTTGASAKASKSSTGVVANTDSYNRLTISYDNTHLSANSKLDDYGYFFGEDAVSLNGFGVEYTHGFSVSPTLPMFVEAGLKLHFGAGKVTNDDDDDVELFQKYQQLSFEIPVNYTYHIAIGENMTFAPYVGINFKIHALGRTKTGAKFDDDELQDYWDDEYADKIDWVNVFSDDEDHMADKDNTWNRFQMGWQIGVGLNIKSFYVGLQYGTDFIQAYKYKKYAVNSGNFTAKIGVNF